MSAADPSLRSRVMEVLRKPNELPLEFRRWVASFPAESGPIPVHDHDDDYAAAVHTHDDRYFTETEINTKLAALWPVGSVFIAVVATNPATLLGFGTWAAFGTGRMLIGVDSGDADFDTAEETGGAKTHTLTEAELAPHTHGRGTSQQHPAENTGAATRITALLTGGEVTGVTGGGAAHNNMPPYIAVYMWKRTA